MANFTELSAKDINEVNGGRILPYIVTGPIITPYIPVIVLGAAAGAVGAALKK